MARKEILDMPLLQKGVALAAGRMPKIIKPQAHAVIDYLVVGSFFVTAALLWKRSRRAAIGSAICGSMTAVNNTLTDYPGGIWKVMSFQTHGKLDAGLAGLTASMPRLMGFDDQPESNFFTMQSMLETAVTAATDFDYYFDYYEDAAADRRRQRDEKDVA